MGKEKGAKRGNLMERTMTEKKNNHDHGHKDDHHGASHGHKDDHHVEHATMPAERSHHKHQTATTSHAATATAAASSSTAAAAVAAPRADELPEGWEMHLSKSKGVYYYVHKVTGEKKWEPPQASVNTSAASKTAAPATIPEPVELPPGWEMIKSKTKGTVYYVNKATGERQWEP